MISRNLFVISGNVSQNPRQFGDKALKTVLTVAVAALQEIVRQHFNIFIWLRLHKTREFA